MTAFRKLGDFAGGYVTTKAAAACEVWIQRLLADGTNTHHWDAADDTATKDRAPEIAFPPTETTWPTRQAVPIEGRWSLRNPSWADVLFSLLAEPGVPGVRGATAEQQLHHVQTAASRLRLACVEVTLPNGDEEVIFLASAASQRRLTLHVPLAGTYELVLGATKPADAPVPFAALMSRILPGATPRRCTTHAVGTTDVYFTWFGPPRDKLQTVRASELPGGQPTPGSTAKADVRGDIRGPLELLRASVPAGAPRPRVRFCCERQHREAFEAEFVRLLSPEERERLDFVVLDDYVGDITTGGRLPEKPDFDDLHVLAAQVIWSIRHRMYHEDGFKIAAHAKDLWSMLCLLRFGGWHMDTGVLPLRLRDRGTSGDVVNLPRPTRFRAMRFGKVTPGHRPLRMGNTGIDCFLFPGAHELWDVLLEDRIGAERRATASYAMPDLGIVCAPAHDVRVERALRTMIALWLHVEAFDPRLGGRRGDGEVRRRLVIAGLLTGLSHPDPVPGVIGPAGRRSRPPANEAFTGVLASDVFDPPELGLRKTGGSSHR